MLVLGRNSDDKGTQLEILTRDLLSDMGYVNIARSFISSGGEEIDVSADYPLPAVAGTQYRRLICECKAHKGTIDLPSWLKFLGVVLFEEARLGREISASFIALSGVNGNVVAHYDELKLHRHSISLVTGDNLLEQIRKLYNLSTAREINESIRQFTSRQYLSLEIAYYERQVHWIVIFEDGAYTMLGAQGEQIEGSRLEMLKPLVEKSLSIHAYVDLQEEAEARRRATHAKKAVLAQLMVNNGTIDRCQLLSGEEFNFTPADFDKAIGDLITQDWIVQLEDGAKISFIDPRRDDFYSRLSEIYLFLLGGKVGSELIAALSSRYHEEHINERMVAEIQRIQGNLPLTRDDVQDTIKLLRWSPSALLWAVQPDMHITTHRTAKDFRGDNGTNQFDRNYFIRMLYGSLRRDWLNLIPRAYFSDVCGLREIETTQQVKVKSKAQVELQADLHERIGIAQLVDSLVGPDGTNKILVLLVENAPQPWELAVQEQTNQGDGIANVVAESPTS